MEKLTAIYQPFIDMVVNLINRIGTTPVIAGIIIWQLATLVNSGNLDPLYGAGGMVITGVAFLIGRFYERGQKKNGGTPPTVTP